MSLAKKERQKSVDNKSSHVNRRRKISKMALELNERDPFENKPLNKNKTLASNQTPKSPYVLIRGPSIDEPISSTIINSFLDEEDKGNGGPGKRRKLIDDSYIPDMSKIDKSNADNSWICVFCKQGPLAVLTVESNTHAFGDLFGPYTIEIEDESVLLDRFDETFKSKATQKKLKSMTQKKTVAWRKNLFHGLTKLAAKTYEYWAHEDCMAWSPNVYMVDNRFYGFDTAVLDSLKTICSNCQQNGANLCCIKKSCLKLIHFRCALLQKWQISTESFSVTCPDHSK